MSGVGLCFTGGGVTQVTWERAEVTVQMDPESDAADKQIPGPLTFGSDRGSNPGRVGSWFGSAANRVSHGNKWER
ncbi:hypothetical protein BN1708_004181 [Verticillium longisporum]|uniref:Uncharacterized protein n=1 Tax=Verticillium longisporum TaxID=100787 RepID=A0A0G4LWQ7_VERLO|nr:hypothetical protein BN1708_004181 [Verticillium longisporum]